MTLQKARSNPGSRRKVIDDFLKARRSRPSVAGRWGQTPSAAAWRASRPGQPSPVYAK